MFYEEDALKSELCCSSCRQEFDEPKCLPCCGEVVCLSCVDKCLNHPETNGEEYKCIMCHQMEAMPRGISFTTSKKMLTMLQIKPKEVYRGELVASLKELIEQLAGHLSAFKCLLQNGEAKIEERFSLIRNQILLHKEQIVKQIDDHAEELLQQLENHKQEIVSAFAHNDSHFEELKCRIPMIVEMKTKWNNYVRQVSISDKIVSEGIQQCEQLNQEMIFITRSAKRRIYNNKWIMFTPKPLNEYLCIGKMSIFDIADLPYAQLLYAVK